MFPLLAIVGTIGGLLKYSEQRNKRSRKQDEIALEERIAKTTAERRFADQNRIYSRYASSGSSIFNMTEQRFRQDVDFITSRASIAASQYSHIGGMSDFFQEVLVPVAEGFVNYKKEKDRKKNDIIPNNPTKPNVAVEKKVGARENPANSIATTRSARSSSNILTMSSYDTLYNLDYSSGDWLYKMYMASLNGKSYGGTNFF